MFLSIRLFLGIFNTIQMNVLKHSACHKIFQRYSTMSSTLLPQPRATLPQLSRLKGHPDLLLDPSVAEAIDKFTDNTC